MWKNLNSGVRVVLTASVLLAPLATFSLPAAPAHAQASRTPMTREQLNEKLAWLGQELNLTDKQKKKARPMVREMNVKLMAVKGNPSLTPDQQRAKSIVIVNNTMTVMRQTILTPQQKTKYDAIKEQVVEKMIAAGKGAPQGQPGG
jgi:hypothetical protein